MTEQPNKPGGDARSDGTPRSPDDEQAVKNQGDTTPDAYPDKADGEKATGGAAGKATADK